MISLHPKKDDLCIGNAAVIEDFAHDYDGIKREKKWDVGADQYGKEALVTPPAKETAGTGAKPAKPEKKITERSR